MLQKSDIESILESQTWKLSSFKSRTTMFPIKIPRKLAPLAEKTANSVSPRLVEEPSSPAFEDSIRRKSILAFPLINVASKISLISKEDDFFLVKIPSFPKLPFANHKEMLGTVPKFEMLPKDTVIDSDNVKSIKIESGRIKKGGVLGCFAKNGRVRYKRRKKETIETGFLIE